MPQLVEVFDCEPGSEGIVGRDRPDASLWQCAADRDDRHFTGYGVESRRRQSASGHDDAVDARGEKRIERP